VHVTSVTNRIINNFSTEKMLIIRSSAADEDGYTNSLAGEYASVLNIPSNNPEKITEAIKTVIASYEKKRPLLPEDEVIIQEMVQDSTMSGVILTKA
jgi:glutamine kinase